MKLSERFRTIGHTDKVLVHTYGEVYDRWLGPWRDRPVHLLEIGVSGGPRWPSGGGSLLAFAEFFPLGTVWGIDNRIDVLPAVREHPAVRLLRGDAYDGSLVTSVPELDIIIDDCLHDPSSQHSACRLYSPRLRSGGLYIVEDISRKTWPVFVERFHQLPWRWEAVNMTGIAGLDGRVAQNNIIVCFEKP